MAARMGLEIGIFNLQDKGMTHEVVFCHTSLQVGCHLLDKLHYLPVRGRIGRQGLFATHRFAYARRLNPAVVDSPCEVI